MTRFVENQRLTKPGSQLIRLIDAHIANKAEMTNELRHYMTAVYKTRMMKPSQWLEQYPDKAEILWTFFASEIENDDDQPPLSGIQPWLIKS